MKALGWMLERLLCSALVLIFGAWALIGTMVQIVAAVLRMAVEVWAARPDERD